MAVLAGRTLKYAITTDGTLPVASNILFVERIYGRQSISLYAAKANAGTLLITSPSGFIQGIEPGGSLREGEGFAEDGQYTITGVIGDKFNARDAY